MDKADKIGLSFGLTSATITILGLMIGLEAGTGSRTAVAAGILTIAIADAFSDALGVHLAKESEGNFTKKEIRRATVSTFAYKFIFALTFLIPVVALPAAWSIYAAIAWGALILIALNYYIAKTNNEKPLRVIQGHLLAAAAVIFLSWGAGTLISQIFKG